jgi:hypothetical protein
MAGLILGAAASAAFAVDWAAFAAASDPSLDPALLEAMRTGDLETRLAICSGLPRRPDPDLSAFIRTLSAEHAGPSDWRTEQYLRLLLAGLLEVADQGAAAARLDRNGAALDELLAGISDWGDPQLVGLLVRVAALRPSAVGIRAVIDAGGRVRARLAATGGPLLPRERSLALDVAAAARSLGDALLLGVCSDIARLSSDAEVIGAARAAARALAAAR